MINEPLVSVLMTAYNREVYIIDAIESVLASTYKNFELIIVDDCSADKTVSIAGEYKMKDNRVRVYLNKDNLGDYPNRNRAASLANGQLLMYVDSDDTIVPNAIEYVVEQFKRFPNTKYATIYHYDDIKDSQVLTSEGAIKLHFYKHPFLHMGPGGTVITREFFEKLGGFPIEYGPANDTYYNIKAACNSDVLLMPYDYLNYRRHDGQEINNWYSYLFNGYRYFEDAMKLNELPLSPNETAYLSKKNKRRFIVNTSKYLFKTGEFKKVFRAYQYANFKVRDFLKGLINY